MSQKGEQRQERGGEERGRREEERKERGVTEMRGWRGELTRQSHGAHTHRENVNMQSLGALCKCGTHVGLLYTGDQFTGSTTNFYKCSMI